MSNTPRIPGKRLAYRPTETYIHVIRGQKVMFDGDLADLYNVPTRALNQAVRRIASTNTEKARAITLGLSPPE